MKPPTCWPGTGRGAHGAHRSAGRRALTREPPQGGRAAATGAGHPDCHAAAPLANAAGSCPHVRSRPRPPAPLGAAPTLRRLTHRELFSPRLRRRRGLKRRGPRCPWLRGPRPHRGFLRQGRRALGPRPGTRRCPPGSWARGPGGPRRPPPPEPAGGWWCWWCWWPRPPRSCRLLCSHSGTSVAVGRRLARLVVAAAGARSRGGRCGSRGAGGGGRGGVSRRRRLELSGCALGLGLLARSYCPKNGPAQVFLGGALAREGRAGEGRGWGKLAPELGTTLISI